MNLMWLLPVLGSMAGAGWLVVTVLNAESAPQTASGAALACALAVIPYVFARSIQTVADNGPKK